MFGLRKRSKGGKSSRSGKGTGRKGTAKLGNRAKTPIRTARKLFHGVSIHTGGLDACDASQALANRRFLADEAPMLPLGDCSNPSGCRCKYQHYDDRRTEARRESDIGLPMKDHPNDARQGVGRRVTDG